MHPRKPSPPVPRATLSIRAKPIDDRAQKFFAPCPRGLEAVLAAELAALSAHAVVATDGGVAFQGPFALGMRVCLWSRIASRVLWQLAEAEYRHEEEIYRLARGVDWPHLFSARETIRVQVDAIRSPLRSLEFVTLRVKDAVVDRFRAAMASRPSVDTSRADMRIHVFLTAYKATVYLDLAGEALFKRGYRRDGLAAPLRENLAAGMLALMGWSGQTPLLDPMCGSGTLLTEAAMIAMNMAPGAQRGFAFEKLRQFDADAFRRMREDAAAGLRPLAPGLLTGNDRSAEAVASTRRHLQNLGGDALLAAVTLTQEPLESLAAPAAAGVLLSNPPYGERLEEQQTLKAWYPALGAWLKRSLAGWRVAFITADRAFPGGIGLKPTRRTPLFNGALDCRLYEFELYAGSRRTDRAPSS
ncbi:MAG: class I SAM-dependent RNA methyltransferase [Proteobacteria bacterium]|nr:class I SAM-dependent RNA methyltransferase [Pseudomonadota bacterium]